MAVTFRTAPLGVFFVQNRTGEFRQDGCSAGKMRNFAPKGRNFKKDYSFSARAESGTTVGDFIVTGGKNGTDYTFEKGDAGKSRNGKLTILTSTKLTISNVHALTATTDRIVIKKDAAALVLFFVWKKKKGL